jgi:hypothetical protein
MGRNSQFLAIVGNLFCLALQYQVGPYRGHGSILQAARPVSED